MPLRAASPKACVTAGQKNFSKLRNAACLAILAMGLKECVADLTRENRLPKIDRAGAGAGEFQEHRLTRKPYVVRRPAPRSAVQTTMRAGALTELTLKVIIKKSFPDMHIDAQAFGDVSHHTRLVSTPQSQQRFAEPNLHLPGWKAATRDAISKHVRGALPYQPKLPITTPLNAFVPSALNPTLHVLERHLRAIHSPQSERRTQTAWATYHHQRVAPIALISDLSVLPFHGLIRRISKRRSKPIGIAIGFSSDLCGKLCR